jgi:hypothetical protein
MPSSFDITNWYWSVQDSSPASQVFSSASGSFVALSDATYVAWLAANGGNQPTNIATQRGLYALLNSYAANFPRPQFVSVAGTNSVQLSNPLPSAIDAYLANPGGAIILPVANLPTSVPLGYTITINNKSTVKIGIEDSAQNLSLGSLNVGDYAILYNTDNTNSEGNWDIAIIRKMPLAGTSGNFITDNGTNWASTAIAWTATTPAPVSSSGTITTASAQLDYFKMGKVVTITGTATVTTVGTASGALKIPLPTTPALQGALSGFNATDGTALLAYVDGSTAFLWLYGAAFGNAFNGNGKTYYFGGTYEST